jgi:hypothetical protein
LKHPSYSPDLSPSDFTLFPKLKLFLVGQRFSSNQKVIAAVEGYFADLMTNQCWSIAGINVLVLREIILKNKNYFEITHSFFLLLG